MVKKYTVALKIGHTYVKQSMVNGVAHCHPFNTLTPPIDITRDESILQYPSSLNYLGWIHSLTFHLLK